MKKSQRKNKPWYEFWHRLKKSKTAMFGMILFILLCLSAIFVPVLAPYGYAEQNYDSVLISGSREHWLGTDNFGRDVLSRILYGGRISLTVGVISVTISAVFGLLIGMVAAYYKKLDNPIMRVIDVFMGIPPILMCIGVAAALGTGMVNMMIALGIAFIPSFARVARSAVLTIRDQEFIEAARSIGCSDAQIILKHILPNVTAPMIVQITLGAVRAIIWASSLSFLGLGMAPPSPEWGALISDGRVYFRDYGYLIIYPGLAIMATTYALDLFGDGLRDALDPRLRG